MEHNHRKNRRFDSHNLISLTCYDKEGIPDPPLYTRALNLSKEGILLESSQPIPVHTKVSMSLSIKEEIILVYGQVVRLEKKEDDKFAVGISFIDITPHDEKKLEKYLHLKEATSPQDPGSKSSAPTSQTVISKFFLRKD
jgi:c-di-GMP-binding flagellar brake protein YcgR